MSSNLFNVLVTLIVPCIFVVVLLWMINTMPEDEYEITYEIVEEEDEDE